MDILQLCAFLVALPLLLLGLLLLRRQGHRRQLPPGPPWLPLLGSVLWLTNSADDVEALLQRLFRRYGPVVTLRVGSGLSIFVADRRVAHAVLVEQGASVADRPRVFVAAELLGENDNTITRGSHGPVWRLLRRNLVSGTLHPSRIRVVSAPARSWARRALSKKLRAGEEVVGSFQLAVFSLQTALCFGERLGEGAVRAIAAAQREQLLYSANQMAVFSFVPWLSRHIFRGRLHRLRVMRQRQRDLFAPPIQARREYINNNNPNTKSDSETTLEHSYVDSLLEVRLPSGEPLSEQELGNLCIEFLTAGTDTTSTALQWIMAELVKHPAIQDRLYREIKGAVPEDEEEVTEEHIASMPYLRAVVLEGLRKHPPGHLVLPHKAAKDVEVGGYLIPKGATVNFMVAEMSRDAEEWENPMQFAPERFLPGGDGQGVDLTGSKEIRMMPFGVGRRICPGLGVAVFHLHYFVASMVREFRWEEVPGEDEIDFAEKFAFTSVMKKPLRPRLVPRSMI